MLTPATRSIVAAAIFLVFSDLYVFPIYTQQRPFTSSQRVSAAPLSITARMAFIARPARGDAIFEGVCRAWLQSNRMSKFQLMCIRATMISTDRNTALLAPTLPVTFTRWINPSVLKESHLMKQVVLAVVLSTCIAGPLAAAEIRYITDEFEITMRSGTSTANNIVRM